MLREHPKFMMTIDGHSRKSVNSVVDIGENIFGSSDGTDIVNGAVNYGTYIADVSVHYHKTMSSKRPMVRRKSKDEVVFEEMSCKKIRLAHATAFFRATWR